MLWIIIISLQIIPVQNLPKVALAKDTLRQEVIPENALYTESCSQIAGKKLLAEKWLQDLNSMKKSIEQNECYKPAAAFSFIDMVISNKAVDHFDFAEELYNRSLMNAYNDTSELRTIKNEARNLLPLLSPEEKNEWEQKINLDNPTLANEIRSFWKIRDPVLSTSTNERLREHWLRIAHAREEYTKNKDGIYGTDDRGTIYIKLGPPTFKRSGMLTLNSTEIRSKLYDLSFFKGGMSQRQLFSLTMSINQQYMPHYYEVWVYRNLDMRRPALFIFGESADKGSFGMRKSVEEFIDTGANRMGLTSSYSFDTGPRGLTAAPFIQMSLYNKLSTIDIYFGRQLTQYDENWLKYLKGDMNFSSLKTLNSSWRAERELREIQEAAPETRSAIKDYLNLVDQDYNIYRFLNDENNPVTKILVFGTPHDKVLDKDALIFQHQYPVYELDHALRIFDESGTQMYADKTGIPLHEEGDSVRSQGIMLEVPAFGNNYQPNPYTVMLSSEISRIPVNKSDRNDPDRVIIAAKNERITQIESLDQNPDSLEVSDIIWGYNSGHKNHNIEELDFAIPSDSKISAGRNLMIYFETYHLKENSTGLHNYRVEYSIHRKKRRKLQDTGIKITLNFSSATSESKEQIEIQTADLESGKYRAFFRFSTPDEPTLLKERSIDFEIEEENEE